MIGGGTKRNLFKSPRLPTIFLFFAFLGGGNEWVFAPLAYVVDLLIIIAVVLVWIASIHILNKYII